MKIKNINISNESKSINDSNVLNVALVKSKRFVLNKDNQKKALKIVSSVSSAILLGDLALKFIPVVIPLRLRSLVSSQLTVMFPTVIQNLKLIPRGNIKKISSNICLFTGIISIASGNGAVDVSKQESINAFHGLNAKDLL